MKKKVTVMLLISSILPVIILTAISWFYFNLLLKEKAFEIQSNIVNQHAETVDAFLQKQVELLELTAGQYPAGKLSDKDKLVETLKLLKEVSDDAFLDLGIIDTNGKHIAYDGPYNLLKQNYSNEEWFKHVISDRIYISDVFLGFRGVPHFIIAIYVQNPDKSWILRSTINSERLKDLLANINLSTSGDVWLVNSAGILQCDSRILEIFSESPIPVKQLETGIQLTRSGLSGEKLLLVSRWVNNNRWFLACVQSKKDVLAPVNRAMSGMLLGIIPIILIIVFISLLSSKRLINQFNKVVAERDKLQADFSHSAKLASVGELATGLAHEINNPLAIIGTEQTNLMDVLKESGINGDLYKSIEESIDLVSRQVMRCGKITRRMLQFGRKKEGDPHPVNLTSNINQIIEGLSHRLELSNILFESNIPENLPFVYADPLELEQVIHNLIKNAIDAMPEGGKINLSARKIVDPSHSKFVKFEITDTGTGITPEVLERIFEPFFTTKSIDRGTGLGLSVCYGMVKSWGGDISIKSSPGQGSTVVIKFSVPEKQAEISGKEA